MNHTMMFKIEDGLTAEEKRDILLSVHNALEEKGYNSVNQLIGYLISGDPTYITTHKDARNLIKKLERDDILEVLINHYIETFGRR
ncbi:MAG: IreB family regulatory phosphoprotein [Bacillota bacterium]|nr:IreB family regulatory phosphoprotein [Bacillota bacterium]